MAKRKCNCNFCLHYRGEMSDKDYIEYLEYEAFDKEYYLAVVEGSYPNADKVIEVIRDKRRNSDYYKAWAKGIDDFAEKNTKIIKKAIAIK